MAITVENSETAKFFIRATVNGEPRAFLLDTGAVHSGLIADEQTKELPSRGRTKFGGFGMQPYSCEWVHVESLKLEGWVYANAALARCENGELGNVIGLDLLKHQTLSLDFENSKISLKAPVPKNSALREMKRGPFGLLQIPVKVAGKTVWATFDTGFGMTVVDKAIVDAHPKAFQPVKDESAKVPFKDASGKLMSGQLYTMTQFEMEGVAPAEQLVTVVEFSRELKEKLKSSIFLGANSIMTANWFFDLEQNKYSAQNFSLKAYRLPTVKVTGDTVIRSDERYFKVLGQAKIADGESWLTGGEIAVDMKEQVAVCTKDCVLAQIDQRNYSTPIKVQLGRGIWNQITEE